MGEVWGTAPANMVDGNIANFAFSGTDTEVQLLDGNTCDGTNLGDIAKVELLVYAWAGGSSWQAKVRPVFGGASDGDDHNIGTVAPPGWSTAIDITSDTNAPGTWSWTDVRDLDCDVEAIDTGAPNNGVYVSYVRIRVTYWGASSVSSVSVSATKSSWSSFEGSQSSYSVTKSSESSSATKSSLSSGSSQSSSETKSSKSSESSQSSSQTKSSLSSDSSSETKSSLSSASSSSSTAGTPRVRFTFEKGNKPMTFEYLDKES